MAAEDLYAALSGLNVSPAETGWGMGTQVLGATLPSLMNPYGSTGSNLGIALGGALLQGLLGYQAKQQAAEQNLALQPLLTSALSAKTPEALDLLLQQEGGERLSSLSTMLKLQMLSNMATQAKEKEEFSKQVQLKLIDQGYIPSEFQKLAPPPSAVDGLSDEQAAAMAGLTPKERRDVSQKLAADKLIEEPKRKQEALDKERRDLTDLGKNATTISSLYNSIEALMTQDSRAADNEIARLGTKIGDPTSVVSPKEAEARIAILPVLGQYREQLKQVVDAGSTLTDAARKDLLRAFKVYVNASKEAYSSQAELAKERVVANKIASFDDPNLSKRLLPFPIPDKTASEAAQSRIMEIQGEIRGGGLTQDKINSLKAEANSLASQYSKIWSLGRD